MTIDQIRASYLEFFSSRHHQVIPRANLVPQNDPTTLFTGSGMQPLLPYLLGQEHPSGTKLVDSQPCFRAEDIDEVGDNRHTTFFEMLGNWSLGAYFKEDQITYFWEFLTQVVGLDPTKLYATAFAGDQTLGIARDEVSSRRWQELFESAGMEARVVDLERDADQKGMQGGRIFYYDASKNWWSRSGSPDKMPAGEPGGPDSEVFYEFTEVEHDPKFGLLCHPNCDCGRFLEIGNSVFMQYIKQDDGTFKELPQKNVDFGGGLERIAAASINSPDVFKIDSLRQIIEKVETLSGQGYKQNVRAMQVIADHLRGVVFLAVDGVEPSNNEQGYVLRRFLRRAIRKGLALGIRQDLVSHLVPLVVDLYSRAYPELEERKSHIQDVLEREERQFLKTLERGVREFTKLVKDQLDGAKVFTLFDTYGFPPELSVEEAMQHGISIDAGWEADFQKLMHQQKERSRTATAGVFKGGLADHSGETLKYHTATHLLYAALKQVLGPHVVQRGSNITAERLRFDFSHPEKMSPEQKQRVEEMVNQAIEDNLAVSWEEVATEKAFDQGASGAFGDKYGASVKVYTVGDKDNWYSKEICGGPHVERTGQIGDDGRRLKIIKEESSSAGVRRIKAVLK